MTTQEFNFEKMKMVYDKVADHHRYYLSWRQYLLAGSFAVFAALSYSSYLLFEKGGYNVLFSAGILVVNGAISILFLLLDKRNRDLYRVCQRVGSKIEQVLFTENKDMEAKFMTLDHKSKDNIALFFTIDNSIYHLDEFNKKSGPAKISHSQVLDFFYISVSIISFGIGIVLIICKLAMVYLKVCSCCHFH